MSKPKKIKHKTKIGITGDALIQAFCLCNWAGTAFTQENLTLSIESARKEASEHYTPKARKNDRI